MKILTVEEFENLPKQLESHLAIVSEEASKRWALLIEWLSLYINKELKEKRIRLEQSPWEIRIIIPKTFYHFIDEELVFALLDDYREAGWEIEVKEITYDRVFIFSKQKPPSSSTTS